MKYLLLILMPLGLMVGCNSNQPSQQNRITDSLKAITISDSSILVYANGLEKLKQTFTKQESPVYKKGDYSFYVTIYTSDSIPVIYQEFGDSGDYGFVEKKYYLDKGDLVLYLEKSKHAVAGEKPSFEFRQSRIYFRNNVFLKAEERKAESDEALNQAQFVELDETLIDKNKQYDFDLLFQAVNKSGGFELSFNSIRSFTPSKNLLITSNPNSGYEAVYQVSKPDSTFVKLQQNPAEHQGKKLNIDYSREGTNMFYKKSDLVF